MEQQAKAGSGKTVCVTGASGYIGSHVVKQLLEKGYTVRGTVRDASNEEKYGWIKQLAKGTSGRVELFSADLMRKGSFDRVMEGCELVCHVAAAVTFVAKNPQKDIVDPAIEGTRNVFSSILKAKCAKRVVVTSTIGAILDITMPNSYVYTEEDWHKEMSIKNPYALGKTLAEKYAWEAYEEQKAKAKAGADGGWFFELVCVHPACVLGELLHKSQTGSSVQVIHQILNGLLPMAPDFHWPIVHVRDVALAHVIALEDPTTHGRYILAEDGCTPFLEIAQTLKRKYPSCSAPTRTMPTWLLYIVALFNPALSTGAVYRNAGRTYVFSNKRVTEEMGISLIPKEKAILDTAISLQDLGIVKPLA